LKVSYGAHASVVGIRPQVAALLLSSPTFEYGFANALLGIEERYAVLK
jgi:hypothetical protein